MDRPRSPVQDAGRWVRSIRRCGCARRWRNTKSGAASPQMGETAPLVGAYSIVRGGPRSRPVAATPRLGAAGFVLSLPVQRLLQPARYGRELTMVVVAVDHLLDVLVLVVVAAVADVLLVAGPVADASYNAGTWPGSCHSWRHIGDGAVACPGHPARDAMRPRWCSAGQASPWGRHTAPRAGVATQGAGARHTTARAGFGGNWRVGIGRTHAGRPPVAPVATVLRQRPSGPGQLRLAGASGGSVGVCRGWAAALQRDRACRSLLSATAAG